MGKLRNTLLSSSSSSSSSGNGQVGVEYIFKRKYGLIRGLENGANESSSVISMKKSIEPPNLELFEVRS